MRPEARSTSPARTVVAGSPRVAARDRVLLVALLAPSLLRSFLDRDVWSSDSSLYGLQALRLSDAWSDGPAAWIQAMLAVSPKPPVLPWLGQFFVPAGRALGHVEAGLLLVPVLATCVALFLFHGSLIRLFASRRTALAGTMMLASAPLLVDMTAQFYVQPLQLLAVAWSIHAMSWARLRSRVLTIVHLAAALLLSLLTMVSGPLFLVAPTALGLRAAFGSGPRAPWRARDLAVTILATMLAMATISWYASQHAEALAYARSSFAYSVGGLQGLGYAGKLWQWTGLMVQATWANLIFVVLSLWALGKLLARRVARAGPDRWHTLLLLQVPVAVAIMARASLQEPRYVLPLVVYVALGGAWAVGVTTSRGSRLLFAVAAAQWLAVNLDAVRAIPEVSSLSRRLDMTLGYRGKAVDRVARLHRSEADRVLLALGGIDIYNLQVEFAAAKQSRPAVGDAPEYRSLEFMLSRAPAIDPRAAWLAMDEWKPRIIVMPSERMRREIRKRHALNTHAWGSVLVSALSISDSLALNPRFARVPDPGHPDIEIYRDTQAPRVPR